MSTADKPVGASDEETPFLTGDMSVKWPRRGVPTNEPAANDPYAAGNNDLDSPMKTFARFAQPMPRPFPKGGRADIQNVPIVVEG